MSSFFFQAEDGIRDGRVTGVQTCALPISDDVMVTEIEVWSVRIAGWNARAASALAPLAEVVGVPDRTFDGGALLVSVGRGKIGAVEKALVKEIGRASCREREKMAVVGGER